MARAGTRHIIVVGGGASGALLTCHLLRDPSTAVRVTLIERREHIGRGLAYGTAHPDHILNVRVANMSAFHDEPDHFWKWLLTTGEAQASPGADPFCFLPRRTYGRYLEDLIEQHLRDRQRPDRLHIVRGEAVAIAEGPSGVAVALADGTMHVGHAAVLATGNEAVKTISSPCSADAWDEAGLGLIEARATILILGTGLTMVDYVLSLIGAGHTGPIYALSRHGLLPQVHRRVEPLRIDAADVPLGTELGYLWRWFRGFVKWHIGRGGDWRSAVDAVRPFTQEIWKNLPLDGKRRFLQHARSWWDVHRHRMAPEVASRLRAVIARGQLKILAARMLSIEPDADAEGGATVLFRRRGEPVAEHLRVGRVVECRGIVSDPLASRNPVLKDLIAKGMARPDPLGIGIDVDGDCALIDANGRPSPHVFALGPLTRAAFWEVIAIPDIRVQCAHLARRLLPDRGSL